MTSPEFTWTSRESPDPKIKQLAVHMGEHVAMVEMTSDAVDSFGEPRCRQEVETVMSRHEIEGLPPNEMMVSVIDGSILHLRAWRRS